MRRYTFLSGALILLGVVTFCSVNVLAQQQANATTLATVVVPVSAEVVPTTVAVPTSEGVVSLDFQDADIKNVLKVLAYKSSMNIVVGPEVVGTVTIQLNDVPWQKALEVVLSTYGYGYERKGNIITVTTVENLKKRHEEAQTLADQEPLATRTFMLNFAKASDVVDSISKMKTSRGQINFDQRTNTLIVRDVQSNIDLIEEVTNNLDTPTPQVLIEAKIIETDFNNTENMGVDWTVNLKSSGSIIPTTFPFHTTSNNKFDPFTIPSPGDPSVSNKTPFTYGTLDTSGLAAALELLSTRSDTNILSNPRIVTLDNQTAKITVGSQYPLPSYTYNQEQAKMQLSGYTYLDIGVIFEVTPHINNAGLVTLDLNPKVTAITALVQVDPSTPAKIPELSTEEAKTKVMIRDGQTLVIAGLVKDTVETTKSKVPFLGDMPFFGQAFKKSNDHKTKTELIIFLTPHIITANAIGANKASAPVASQ
ncbi:MAG: type IV pilus secretin PilQ [Candidatus Omnitrophica bacterium]|nr:type IV pilus secretin PilQ [Candidatus Omnitrophota bacterium]